MSGNKLFIQSINQLPIVSITPEKPGSVAREPNQCPTAKLKIQFHDINEPLGIPVSQGERLSQRHASSDVS